MFRQETRQFESWPWQSPNLWNSSLQRQKKSFVVRNEMLCPGQRQNFVKPSWHSLCSSLLKTFVSKCKERYYMVVFDKRDLVCTSKNGKYFDVSFSLIYQTCSCILFRCIPRFRCACAEIGGGNFKTWLKGRFFTKNLHWPWWSALSAAVWRFNPPWDA